MAVFEYKGVQISTGKAVKGFRDAENARALRGLLRRDGILLTLATEERERKEKQKRNIAGREEAAEAKADDGDKGKVEAKKPAEAKAEGKATSKAAKPASKKPAAKKPAAKPKSKAKAKKRR